MLEVRGLTKRYGGLLAVDKVSFSVNRGEVVGYLGPNGSGKSTTVNMVVGLLEPGSGEIFLDGTRKSDDPVAYKRRIGYVPEEPYLYTHLTALEYLTLVGRLRDIPPAPLERKASELLRLFLLYDSRYATMAAFSKGMRQRVLLAAALLHNPDLLVLDEPFSGLDVNAALLFQSLIGMFAAEGRMILFSTHRFDMVEKLCSRAVILSKGKLVAEHVVSGPRQGDSASLRRAVCPCDRSAGFRARRARNPRGDARRMTKILTRHFFDALFDFGVFSQEGADAFVRVIIGIFSVIIAVGLLIARVYMIKYGAIRGADAYLRALNADTAMTFGLPMWTIAFITVLISHSLVPDETDFRVLMPLPVRQPFVFGTKLLALFLFIGLFTTTSLVAVTPLTFIIGFSRHALYPLLVSLLAFWLVGASACAFVVVAVVALNGLLSMCLPKSRVHGAAAAMRSAMLAGLMLVLPLVLALPADADRLTAHSRLMYLAPPAWFLGIERVVFGGADDYLRTLARIGVVAFAAAAAISVVSYALLYARFDRVMMRSLQVSRRLIALRTISAKLDMRAAISAFTHATLRRSALHQGVLIGLSACGVSLGLNRIMDAEVIAWLRRLDAPKFDVMVAIMGTPWLLMFGIGLATRAAIALPIEQRANWIFRMTESEATRSDQLRAVTRLMRQMTVGVPLVLMAPLEWALFGPRAVFALGMNAVCGLLWIEVLLRDWRRIPFTCSYIPGKQIVAQTTTVGVGVLVLGVTVAGALAVSSARSVVFFAVMGSILTALTLWLRSWRLAGWQSMPLEFDDKMPSAFEGLNLQA